MAQVPKQLLILRRLTAHLEGITPDNGYAFNLAGKVYRGRTVFGDEVAPPYLSILEAPRPDDSVVSAGSDKLRRSEQWVLLIQGWTPDDGTGPTDTAYELKAAVEKRLSEVVVEDGQGRAANPDSYKLGGLIDRMTIGPGVVRPPTEGVSATAFFYLPVVVGMTADIRNPFVTVEP